MSIIPFLHHKTQMTTRCQADRGQQPQRQLGLRLLALCLTLMLGLGLIQPAQAALVWQIQVVDSGGNVGLDSSLVLDSNGFPVISYFDLSNGRLKVLHCGNATCSSGNSIRVVDSGDVGGYSSLALDGSGNPVISYFDFVNSDLKLAHCGNSLCSSGNSIRVVDSSDAVGWFSTLRLDSSGRPVIAYFDSTNYDLKLVRCGDSLCSSGNRIITLDSGETVGRDPSLRLDSSGRPVVTYYDITNGDLKLVRCGSAECFGNTTRTLDSAGEVGEFSSLALDSSGKPVISYYDFSNHKLKVIRCGDATCGSGNSMVTVDSAGGYTSLVLDSSGKPVISYYDGFNSDLKLVYCGDTTCSSGNTIQTVDNAGVVGLTNSLALDSSGKPVIAYYDEGNSNLKVARWIDNSPPPSVTLNQAAAQADPTNSNPVLFSATFSEPVSGFSEADVTLSGTANLAGASITVSGGPSDYTISVSGLAGNGTVIATIAAGVAADSDGNLTTASSSSDNSVTVNLDSTPPVITPNVVGTVGNNGWYTSDVTVSWSVVDNESAISSQSGCDTQTITSDTVGVTFTCTASSAGGNNSQSITLQRDGTAPTITFVNRSPANSNGWNNSDVTVNWSCSDATAGVVAASVSQVVSSEGANQVASASCIDNAGNSASDTQNGINLDKTAPSLNPLVTPNPIPLNGAATVTAGATDALSGLASQSCGALDTSSVGVKSVICTATDNADNTASATVNYTVAYPWNGFFQPVDNLPTVNTVNAGQAIPVKFSLGGDYGLNIFASGYPASQNVSCGSSGGSASTSPIEETATAGNSSLQYDPGTQSYIYVWKTDKTWAGTCRQLIVRLNDGTDHIALFQFNGKVRSADAEGEAEVVQQIFLPLVNR